jgi:GTP-binding protein LepA
LRRFAAGRRRQPGRQAQTLANVYHALDAGHEIVPALNKIDLPAAEPTRSAADRGCDRSRCLRCADDFRNTGLGIDDVLEAIAHRLPPPNGDPDASLKALLVDSWYDVIWRRGAGAHCRWRMKKGQRIRMMGTNAVYDVERVGFFTPKMQQIDELGRVKSALSPPRSRKWPTPGGRHHHR